MAILIVTLTAQVQNVLCIIFRIYSLGMTGVVTPID
jgi:hypothetical protein